MTPEAKDYLEKAHAHLGDARKVAAIGLANLAARSAYYAAFHAAQALIFERTGKIAKTLSGVRCEFARLAKVTPGGKKLSAFLAQAYLYKEIADYGVGDSAAVSIAEAEDAMETAARFIESVAGWLTQPVLQ